MADDEFVDLNALKKDDVVAEAEARGLEPDGTKAELIDEILEADAVQAAHTTNPDFDPDNPGGMDFAPGGPPDPDAEIYPPVPDPPITNDEFDPDNPGGQSIAPLT